MIEIETGIEITEPKGGRNSDKYGLAPYREALRQLEVGQSIFVPVISTLQQKDLAGMVLSGCHVRKVNFTKRFKSRSAEKNGVKGCRIWRVA